MNINIPKFRKILSTYKIQLKYLAAGTVFGLMFPIIAVSMEIINHGKSLNLFNFRMIIEKHPLLIMISTAPLFLGIFSLYAGMNHAKIIKEKEKLKEITDLLQEKSTSLEKNNETLRSEIAERVVKIKHMAFHDYLTGLPNKLLFKENLENAIRSSKHSGEAFSVMFIDLDNFKNVNDTFGHTFGDELLKSVANRLSEVMDKNSFLCRNGGDEFVMLLNKIQTESEIENKANRICSILNSSFSIRNEKINISASIGIAVYPFDGQDSENLLKFADIAMYKAKECGKNRHILCSSVLVNDYGEKLNLSKDLYYAIENDELRLMYQPQVNSSTNEIIGVEALLRWDHPTLGTISPVKFIPLAEKTGLILPIGEWVLKTACKQNKAWQKKGLKPIKVSVNLSVKQLVQDDIISIISSILDETRLNPEYLELEVTENIAIMETEDVFSVLSSLKNLGATIAIDDFGTGYSSLNYIKKIPVDRIKIDKEFVSEIQNSTQDQAIAKTIITLGRSLNKSVLAEGVETIEQLEFLDSIGCNEIQGYYYYKPLAPNDVEPILL